LSSYTYTPLSQQQIRLHLTSTSKNHLDGIVIHQSVLSTNDVLWQRLSDGNTRPAVCLSETQTAGRGRRGDQWHSPDSGNIYLSLSWSFPAETVQNGLSLAIGISLINSLKEQGINDLQIKWPNDILYKRQKLAGILVESRFGKSVYTVIGIGLNFKLPAATQNQIQQQTTSLQQLCTHVPCRNKLAGKIINTMITTLEHFETHGLKNIIPQWSHYDALANQHITLVDGEQQHKVLAQGINEKGELLYKDGDSLHSLSNSRISVRFSS